MTDPFWPGDHRADPHFTGEDLLTTMVRLEADWLGALVDQGVAPPEARDPLLDLVGEDWLEQVSRGAEAGGNPVIPLVALLRDAVADRSPEAATWLHRGLTSQDVLDSAIVLISARVVGALVDDLTRTARTLGDLIRAHRDTGMVGRTLTQHAVPTTFGFRVAAWVTGLLDAREDLVGLELPGQLGGAAGTRAALVELGVDASQVTDSWPWQTIRTPLTRLGDALVRCTDGCARIANDVVVMGRPEIRELAEGQGGGSSTMPHKTNPVLSVQIRRAALCAPPLAATLHLAAAGQVDDRPDGAWHAEWATLRDLARRTLVAVRQTADLVEGLVVHADEMASTLAGSDEVWSEQQAMAALVGRPPRPTYEGESARIIDAVLDRIAEDLP